MAMPGRNYSTGSGYRYGFNGKENDNETGTQDYGMRIYDPRTGKFLSVDPLTKKYAELTPYQFASNSPIENVDLDGAEKLSYAQRNESHNVVDFIGNLPGNVVVTAYNGVAGTWNKGVDYYQSMNQGDPIAGFNIQLQKDWDEVKGTVTSIWNYHANTPIKQQGKDFLNQASQIDTWSQATEGAIIFYASAKLPVLKTQNKTVTALKAVTRATAPIASEAIDYVALAAKYTKNRPKFRQGTIQKVWEAAKDVNGKVFDPNTFEELTWDKFKSRFDQWHMGHKPGFEYKRLIDKLKNGKISQKEFLNEYNNPNNYRPEAPSANMSHKFEDKTPVNSSK